MQVSEEQLLHIANLARLELDQSEVSEYLNNLQDILNFAEKINSAPTEGLGETIGAESIGQSAERTGFRRKLQIS